MYQYLPCDRDTVKHTGTVPLVLHTDRCTNTYPVIETQSSTQVQYLWCYTHRDTVMYQYLPCDRDAVKHTVTVPLMLHTDRCTSTYPVIETQSNTQVQYLWCNTQTDVPDRCTYPVMEAQSNTQVKYLWCTHTDRCTSTYHVIETQSNTQVQYLWCYKHTQM